MVETKITEYRIGHLRLKYLDLANIAFAQNNYVMAKGYIDDFLETVPEDIEAAKIVKQEFDNIVVIKNANLKKLEEQLQHLSYLEKMDVKDGRRNEIEINALHDRKSICWKVAMEKDCSMNEDTTIGSKRIYKQPLNYENGVILAKIRDISLWRDTNIKAYESGVMTLALLLPHELRDKALGAWKNTTTFEDLTMDGKKDFDDLMVFILKLLEDHNICFPKISFDIGHD